MGGVSRTSAQPPGHSFRTGNGRPCSDDQVPAALLFLCEWWVGLSVEERSGLLEAAELAEIDRKVDAAVLGEATSKTTSTMCPIEPTFLPTDEEGQL
ncbi:MAG: hypothetical protein JWR82_2682 [Blastococcus sp.]|nr:hypothetical protein [Blastococcus sp.]